jgi:hypothetical protein
LGRAGVKFLLGMIVQVRATCGLLHHDEERKQCNLILTNIL